MLRQYARVAKLQIGGHALLRRRSAWRRVDTPPCTPLRFSVRALRNFVACSCKSPGQKTRAKLDKPPHDRRKAPHPLAGFFRVVQPTGPEGATRRLRASARVHDRAAVRMGALGKYPAGAGSPV